MLDYCLTHTSPASPVLQELERATHLRTLSPQMLAGPYQGMLLQMFSHMIRPQRVLEIGAFTGYGAICLAQGLAPDGRLHTVEVDDEVLVIAREFIHKAGLADRITLHHGDAALIVPQLQETFDLVYLDAGKLNYIHHYDMVLPMLRPGGFLLADNVLWDGKVLHDAKDATAQLLREFNDLVQADERVENLLLPLRDGMMVVRKR
jgi:predicted O-methyltransferase YrrM